MKSLLFLTVGLLFVFVNNGFSSVMIDSSKILTYDEFIENLDGTINAPDPSLEYTADFPYCNSISTYPSPFLPTEFSSLPFSTFCSGNVVNSITNRGTDVSYQVVVGGNFNVPATGGAELEGRLAILGDLVVDKAPAPFRVGESISGTAVVSEPGSFLLVGGNASGSGRINTGASAFGVYTSEIGGSSDLTINGSNVVTGVSLSYDIDTLIAQARSMSDLMKDLPSTGSFSSGFLGTNSSLEVFNISSADLLGTGVLPFTDISSNSTIIINVTGSTVNYQKSVYNGRINDPLAISNSSDVDATVYNVVWNFYEATALNVISSPAEGIQGLVLVPNGDVDFRTNLNGRLITGGDVNVNGSGAEFHNYPFTGDLSEVIATAPSIECVIAVKDYTMTQPESQVIISPIENDTIEDGLTLEVTISENPLNGTVQVNPDNTINYIPDAGFTGLDSLKYSVCDVFNPLENCDSAFIVILVGFEAIDDDLVAQTNELTTFFPLQNDIINYDKTVLDTISSGTGGELTLNPDGSVNYISDIGFSGRDTIVFLVCDTSSTPSVCDTSIAIIRVLSILPDAIDDNYATAVNTSVFASVLDNDTYASKSLLSIRLLANTSNGSLIVQPDFSYSYTPNIGFTGLDSFRYEICDTTILPGVCDSALVIITVEPEAINDTIETIKETAISFYPIDNDIVNPIVTTIDSLYSPQNGTLEINPDGELIYIPDNGFVGNDSFEYVVCDTSSSVPLCDTALVFVNVFPESPVAVNDVTVTEFNTSIDIAVLVNDDIKSVSTTEVSSVSVETSSGGLVSINPDGTINYSPFNDFRGLDTLSYVICDTSVTPHLCDTALIEVMVGPLAVDDIDSTLEGLSISIFPLENDTINFSKTTFEVIPFTGLNGVIIVDNNIGKVEYHPVQFFSGIDTVFIKVCDTSNTPAVCDTSMLVIKVLPSPPVVISDFVQIFANQSINVDFRLNDIIPHRNTTKTTTVVDPNFGDITDLTDSTFNYTPDLDFLGLDSVQYVLCDTALLPWTCDTGWVVFSVVEKDAPIAVQDVRATELNTTLIIDVLDNDTLPDNINTIVKSVTVSSSSNASVIVLPDGTISYEPFGGFKGLDTLLYVICDTSVNPPLSDSALIIISVAPEAVDDIFTIESSDVLVATIFENDTINTFNSSLDTLAGPKNGTLVVGEGDTLIYTPDLGFSGIDTVIVLICDTSSLPPICDTSLFIINVLPGPPIAVNDTVNVNENVASEISFKLNDIIPLPLKTECNILVDPVNGNYTLENDSLIIYNPNLDFVGRDSLRYMICDTSSSPNKCDTAWVVISVTERVAPVVVDDVSATYLNTPVNIAILSNDQVPNITTTTISNFGVLSSSSATIDLETDGTITYVPFTGFKGFDSLFYVLCDTAVIPNLCDTGLAIITVAPEAVNDSISVDTEEEVVIDVLDNDTLNSSVSEVTIIAGPNSGTIIDSSGGTVTYVSDSNFVGYDTLLIVVCDTSVLPGVCDTSSVVIKVSPELFLAVDDNYYLSPNTDITINSLENDTLSPESNLRYTIVSLPENGLLEGVSEFGHEYTPTTDFIGSDEFVYAVCDTVLIPEICDTAVVSFVVSQLPLALPDTLFLDEDEIGTINLLTNDIDVNENSVVLSDVTLTSTDSFGVITWDSTGTVMFTPDLNAFGVINYNYIISDELGGGSNSTLVIVVASVNDSPIVNSSSETLTMVNDGDNGNSPNVLLNNSDPDGDELYVKNIIVSQADFVGYTFSDSTISYLPTSDFIGTDTVLYNVCDRGSPELCVVDTLIVVVTEGVISDLFVPEAFSPNNDGKNDFFEILGLENYSKKSLKVFNRWGVTVFQDDSYQNDWDGTNNVSLSGALLPAAGYLYVLNLISASGEDIVIKGSVFINR